MNNQLIYNQHLLGKHTLMGMKIFDNNNSTVTCILANGKAVRSLQPVFPCPQ